MRLIKATQLARMLGISTRSVAKWCKEDPNLAFLKGRQYYIKLDELARRPGFDLVAALTLENACWVRAVDYAAAAGRPRRNVAHLCKTKPRFAKRIGRIWYIDLVEEGLSADQIAVIKSLIPPRAPRKKATRAK